MCSLCPSASFPLSFNYTIISLFPSHCPPPPPSKLNLFRNFFQSTVGIVTISYQSAEENNKNIPCAIYNRARARASRITVRCGLTHVRQLNKILSYNDAKCKQAGDQFEQRERDTFERYARVVACTDRYVPGCANTRERNNERNSSATKTLAISRDMCATSLFKKHSGCCICRCIAICRSLLCTNVLCVNILEAFKFNSGVKIFFTNVTKRL